MDAFGNAQRVYSNNWELRVYISYLFYLSKSYVKHEMRRKTLIFREKFTEPGLKFILSLTTSLGDTLQSLISMLSFTLVIISSLLLFQCGWQ